MIDILYSAIRLKRDVNGNPRYYFARDLFPPMTDKTRRAAGLTLYRGKRYSAGYVMQSYNLGSDIVHALYEINHNI
jgi:hypothetical protein